MVLHHLYLVWLLVRFRCCVLRLGTVGPWFGEPFRNETPHQRTRPNPAVAGPALVSKRA